jgi:membrane protein YdbS with pleckstrin-like domain
MNKEKIAYILIVVWIILVAIMILWYTFGHSPTVEQILTIAVVTPYVFVFGIYERLNNRINDNYEKLNDKISKTREDFHHELNEIKTQLGRIEEKITK